MLNEFFDFIDKSPCSFFAVKNAAEILLNNGFSEISENSSFDVKRGGSYFVRRNNSSLIAFRLPAEDCDGFKITASHSDSPSFRVKPKGQVYSCGVSRLNVEKYGGMVLSSWLDRPLSVAGRIVAEEKGKLKEILVNIDKDLLTIPSLAIHFNRDVNNGSKLSVQKNMLPLFSGQADDSILDIVAEFAGVPAESILGSDLFVYNRDKARVIGSNGEFILSPRLDDLMCAFACLKGFVGAEKGMYCFFDNEETGSGTKQGALSDFLEGVVKRICMSAKYDYYKVKAGSFMLSADNAHAVHPGYPEKSDIVNRPVMNGGVVIKYNGNQKYSTDALSEAVVKQACKRANVPWQCFVNNSDIAGGSTLGNLSAQRFSVNTADIGLAQLAMHSANETGGARDIAYLADMVKEFYNM